MTAIEAKQTFWKNVKENMEKYYMNLKDKKIVIWGTGSYAELLMQAFEGTFIYENIVAVSDNNSEKWGKVFKGKPIESIDVIAKSNPEFKIIIASQYYDEIKESLGKYAECVYEGESSIEYEFIMNILFRHLVMESGSVEQWIEKYAEFYEDKDIVEKIDKVISLLEDSESKEIYNGLLHFFRTGETDIVNNIVLNKNQYFDNRYYNIGEHEIFVDCGAYDGDTVEEFMHATNGKYDKIYALEPDEYNYKHLTDMINENQWNNIETFQLATGKEKGVAYFENLGNTSSKLTKEEGDTIRVNVDSLDHLIKGPVTWIKMDIEGAEVDTLKGAKNLIQKYKPKLAICIYHLYNDLFEIPLLIHDMVPEYKMKIGHHLNSLTETVLYAYIPEE